MKTKPLLHESLFDLYCNGFPDCIRFTDMGCSSGPNAFLPTLQVIEALDTICSRLKHKPPILHAFLNDLPGNDFNTVSKSLPSFYERLKTERGHDDFGSCFIAAAPGSFHGRLFPPCFLNLVYSSFCLHWLSRVNEPVPFILLKIIKKLKIYKNSVQNHILIIRQFYVLTGAQRASK